MSKAYGRKTTFNTNFDFMTTAHKNFVFIVTKQGNVYILSFMRSGKNSICMVNRQRQSISTHNGSEMIMFSRFESVLQIAFSKKPPIVVPHHIFVTEEKWHP